MSCNRGITMMALGVWLFLATGCGNPAPPGLHAVSGTVFLDEQPLDEGNIIFFPSDSGSVASGGEIHDGEFLIPKHKGLALGTYKVSIAATLVEDPVSPDVSDPHEHPPNVIALIPAKFNSQTTLTADVVNGSDNVFTFKLKSEE